MSCNSIAFVAGRSGGHIIPALTLAKQYVEKDIQCKILFFSTSHPLDQKIIKQSPHIQAYVPLKLDNISLLNPFALLLFICKLIPSTITSFKQLRAMNVEKVISMGGYISLPVCIAATFLRIPIDVYELNAVPGKATKFIAPFARTIHICFEQARANLPAKKCLLSDYPVRFDNSAKKISTEQARANLGLHPTKKTIFIHGGSQGSVSINNHIKTWLEFNAHIYALIQVIHQTGAFDKTPWKKIYEEYDIPAVVFDFRDDLVDCYAAADVIISRAGAGALFELVFFNKPSIIIPLEANSTSHQKDNALEIAKRYPELFTILTEQQIKYNNMILFSVMNRYLYGSPTTPDVRYTPPSVEQRTPPA